MAKKICTLVLTVFLMITFYYSAVGQATDKNPRLLKWQVTNYKINSFYGWDQTSTTKFQDSIEVTLYVCFSQLPETFILVFKEPYQFFYAERDSNFQISKCRYQEGLTNENDNNQWSISLIKKFLELPENTTNLPPKIANFLETTYQYGEVHFGDAKTSSP